ncbi:MAG: T9SS type A sorting domain-containing protein [Bacteroidetes bacterium]|nr:T9SS type A sorting domain-containing protein [Bacteroidota bacterium]
MLKMFTAIIGFSVPNTSAVTMKVYDAKGKLVATPVDEKKPAGIYKVEFDGTGLPSGIYFYQLRAGNYIETKKMVLLR